MLVCGTLLFTGGERCASAVTEHSSGTKSRLRMEHRELCEMAGAIPGSSVFQFCVDGDAFLGFALSKELQTVRVGNQKTVVRLVNQKSDLRGCEALIFTNVNRKQVENALQEVQGGTVLTMGDTEGFLMAGGVVHLSHETQLAGGLS